MLLCHRHCLHPHLLSNQLSSLRKIADQKKAIEWLESLKRQIRNYMKANLFIGSFGIVVAIFAVLYSPTSLAGDYFVTISISAEGFQTSGMCVCAHQHTRRRRKTD